MSLDTALDVGTALADATPATQTDADPFGDTLPMTQALDEADCQAWRARILHFLALPGAHPEDEAGQSWEYFPDGILLVRDGRVEALGDAAAILPRLPPGTHVHDRRGMLILPGFIDAHVHYPQTDVIASHGTQLLDWLSRHVFPTEERFADIAHARAVAEAFLDEALRNGTTTAAVYCTVHPASVDAFFEAAGRRDLCMIAGKAMMDSNVPPGLRDTAQDSFDDSAALIERWHERDRLRYAVTPRFAPASSPRQLDAAARLYREYPEVWLQSHVAENVEEVAWAAELFPGSRSYLDIYDHFGLLGPRCIYGHCIHLDDADRRRMAESGAAMAFCPSSNLFLGSGSFDLAAARRQKAQVAIGSDVGAGTSFSMLRTAADGYKVLQSIGQNLSPWHAFHLMTLGNAQALHLADRLGNLRPGKDADFIVVDLDPTPLMKRRMDRCRDPGELLFALMMLGDDRNIHETCVRGVVRHARHSPAR